MDLWPTLVGAITEIGPTWSIPVSKYPWGKKPWGKGYFCHLPHDLPHWGVSWHGIMRQLLARKNPVLQRRNGVYQV